MKRFFVLLLSILLSLNALAQLEVKKDSFKKVEGFVNINLDKQTDDNDRPYAVLKIRTENIDGKQRRELNFQGDARTFFEVEYKDGEVWLYISYYATYLKISHDDFSSTEFWFPFDMEPKCGYEMTLVNKAGMPAVSAKEQFNYLIIKADQPNAVIYIDGLYAGDGEAAKTFKVGEKHQWSIECEMYYPESGSVTIMKENPVTIEKKLRPAFGYIYITTEPENGATVFVDNKRIGETPCTTGKLASGTHKVRVMKEMFFTSEQTFAVTDGNTTQAVMHMTANFVSVNVTTDSQSDIYVDNELKGRGSWIGRMSEGDHIFEAKKASHKTTVKNVTLAIGRNENIVIPNPLPIYGTLDVNSSPMGATIMIDGKNYGTTPRVLNEILVGNHELILEKTGYSPVTKAFVLDEKNILSLNEKLQENKQLSKISISDIAFANVENNGTIIDNFGSRLTDLRMRYLTSEITYDCNDNSLGEVEFYITIRREWNNKIYASSTSPDGFTTKDKKKVSYGKNKKLRLMSWGSTDGGVYPAGTYIYEVWYGGEMLISKKLVVHNNNDSNGFVIKKVEFANEDYNEKLIDGIGSRLVSSRLEYLKPTITYDCTNSNLKEIGLYIKIKTSNNGMKYGNTSPSGFTTWCVRSVSYGRNQKMRLTGWGNTQRTHYKPGSYTYEIWAGDKMLYSQEFEVY